MNRGLRLPVAFLLCICVVLPAGAWAFRPGHPAFSCNQQTGDSSDWTEVPAVKKRFRLEVFGGSLSIDPKDFNLFPPYEDRLQAAQYDDLLLHLKDTGAILEWSKSQTGERDELKDAVYLGIRIKYLLSRRIGISLGFRYLTSRQGQDLAAEYTRTGDSGGDYVENLEYFPFSISTHAYIPSVGVHVMGTLHQASSWEIFVSGGPVFAACHYLSEWSYSWLWRSGATDFPLFSSQGVLELQGSGTGLAVEAGARVGAPLGSRWDLFFEGGYAYQVVNRISGPGREVVDAYQEEWEGEWSVRSETVDYPWGAVDVVYPSNYRPQISDEGILRGFKLDLSGFQIRIGFGFRF